MSRELQTVYNVVIKVQLFLINLTLYIVSIEYSNKDTVNQRPVMYNMASLKRHKVMFLLIRSTFHFSFQCCCFVNAWTSNRSLSCLCCNTTTTRATTPPYTDCLIVSKPVNLNTEKETFGAGPSQKPKHAIWSTIRISLRNFTSDSRGSYILSGIVYPKPRVKTYR